MISHGFCHDITPEHDLAAAPPLNRQTSARLAVDVLVHDGWLYLTQLERDPEAAGDRRRVQACDLASGIWQPLSEIAADHIRQLLPITAEGTPIKSPPGMDNWLAGLEPSVVSRITHAACCSGQLYLALRDREAGFSLLSADLQPQGIQYRPVLARGAERYLHNAEVFALAVLDDKLFIAAGTSTAARVPDSAYFDYQGFELLRVDRTGEWDILAGVPRPSPAGLKLPLSALGPGLGARQTGAIRRREWQLLHAQAGRLLLATSDEDGLRLWHSRDGIDWQTAVTDAFKSLDQIEGCDVLECGPSTMILRVETTDFDDQRRLHLFFLNLDQIEQAPS